MADSNRLNLAYVAESTWGTTPAGPPILQDLRFTSESLGQDTNSVTSQEIRSDRQVADIIRTGVSVSGDINGELSYGTYDDFFASVLYSAGWSTAVVVDAADTAISVTSTSVFTHATAWAITPTVGMWIRVSGFVAAGNNGFFKVTAATSTTITVAGTPLTIVSAGPAITINQGAQIVNGTTETSFTVEKEYSDLTNEFASITGLIPATMNLSVAADQIVTLGFGLLGKTETTTAATVGDGTNDAATTSQVMNGIDHVRSVSENAASLSITAFSMEVQNNLRQRLQVATLGPISIGAGFVNPTGTVQAYYTSAYADIVDKYIADTASSLALVLRDGSSITAANHYVVEFPRIKYSAARRVAGGVNQDILADMSWSAYREPTEGVTCRIVRFPAV